MVMYACKIQSVMYSCRPDIKTIEFKNCFLLSLLVSKIFIPNLYYLILNVNKVLARILDQASNKIYFDHL